MEVDSILCILCPYQLESEVSWIFVTLLIINQKCRIKHMVLFMEVRVSCLVLMLRPPMIIVIILVSSIRLYVHDMSLAKHNLLYSLGATYNLHVMIINWQLSGHSYKEFGFPCLPTNGRCVLNCDAEWYHQCGINVICVKTLNSQADSFIRSFSH